MACELLRPEENSHKKTTVEEDMNKQNEKTGVAICDSPSEYRKLRAFNEQLLDQNSRLGRIISSERIRKGGEHIQNAIRQAIVNNGHGAMIQQTRPRV